MRDLVFHRISRLLPITDDELIIKSPHSSVGAARRHKRIPRSNIASEFP